MDIKNYLKGEAQRELAAAQELTEKLGNDGSSATAEQRAVIEAHMVKAAEFRTKISDIEENDALKKSIDDLGGLLIAAPKTPASMNRVAVSLGDAFTKSATYQALMKRNSAVPFQTEPVTFGFKANETTEGTPDIDDTYFVQADVQAGLSTLPQRPLLVADILGQGTTNSNVVRYPQVLTSTNNADDVAELGSMPQSVLAFKMVNEPVVKVATYLVISDEMLQDAGSLRGYIDSQMGYFVNKAKEDQIVSGTASSEELGGFLTRSIGAITQGGDTIHDVIYKAKSYVRKTAFVEPDAVIVHPTDWEGIRLAKDGIDNYFNGLGPFMGGGTEPPYWGLKVVVTPAITQGTVLVGAFGSMATLFQRGGLTLDASNSNGTDFVLGQVTLRAVTRFALATYRLDAFCKVTLS